MLYPLHIHPGIPQYPQRSLPTLSLTDGYEHQELSYKRTPFIHSPILQIPEKTMEISYRRFHDLAEQKVSTVFAGNSEHQNADQPYSACVLWHLSRRRNE